MFEHEMIFGVWIPLGIALLFFVLSWWAPDLRARVGKWAVDRELRRKGNRLDWLLRRRELVAKLHSEPGAAVGYFARQACIAIFMEIFAATLVNIAFATRPVPEAVAVMRLTLVTGSLYGTLGMFVWLSMSRMWRIMLRCREYVADLDSQILKLMNENERPQVPQ